MTTFDQCLGAWFSGTLLEVMRACEDAMGTPNSQWGEPASPYAPIVTTLWVGCAAEPCEVAGEPICSQRFQPA